MRANSGDVVSASRCNLLTPTAVSLIEAKSIMHDLSPILKQHLVIAATCQRPVEGRGKFTSPI
jgi:hypothetical protein